MSFKKSCACACAFLLMCAAALGVGVGERRASAQAASDRTKPPDIEFVTAQELKTKLARNESVTMIDLLSSSAYAGSNGKIRGAIHVKEKRLRSRLAFPPLRDVPHDGEIVIYCACPNDEASVRAAQLLSAAGFKRVRVLKGGWRAWVDAGGQVESKPQGL